MNPKIYQLEHNKESGTLKVSPITKVFDKAYANKVLTDKPQDYIYHYNSNYFFSFSRKALVQLAKKMKEEWIKELEDKLEVYKSIKI